MVTSAPVGVRRGPRRAVVLDPQPLVAAARTCGGRCGSARPAAGGTRTGSGSRCRCRARAARPGPRRRPRSSPARSGRSRRSAGSRRTRTRRAAPPRPRPGGRGRRARARPPRARRAGRRAPASTSSSEPGKVTTPTFTRRPALRPRRAPRSPRSPGWTAASRPSRAPGRAALVGASPVDLELEPLALPDVGHALEPQPGQRAEHRLALGVEDLGLGHDVDDETGHGRSRACRLRYAGHCRHATVYPRGVGRLGA